MTVDEIERLLRRLERTDIAQFEIADAASSLKLRFGPEFYAPVAGAGPAEATAPSEEPGALLAGAIGRLRLRHPEAAPKADESFPRTVMAGDIVAFLEAGAVLRPVIAEKACTIGPPLEAEGALIGYGTPLFPIV